MFFVGACVFSQPGVDRDVVSDQVHHLLRLSVRSNLDIHIVPEAAGRAVGEPFELIEFRDNTLTPIVGVESLTSTALFGREETVSAYREIVAELADIALDQEHTRTWLRNLASDIEGVGVNGGIVRLDRGQPAGTEIYK